MDTNIFDLRTWVLTIAIIVTVITFVISQYKQNKIHEDRYNRLSSSEQFNFIKDIVFQVQDVKKVMNYSRKTLEKIKEDKDTKAISTWSDIEIAEKKEEERWALYSLFNILELCAYYINSKQIQDTSLNEYLKKLFKAHIELLASSKCRPNVVNELTNERPDLCEIKNNELIIKEYGINSKNLYDKLSGFSFYLE